MPLCLLGDGLHGKAVRVQLQLASAAASLSLSLLAYPVVAWCAGLGFFHGGWVSGETPVPVVAPWGEGVPHAPLDPSTL